MTEAAPTTRLAVHWRDFDGCVKAIRSRSRGAAATIRRERNHNSRRGVLVRVVPHFLIFEARRGDQVLGIRRIWYGDAAYQAKLLRGCELVSSPIFYRPRTAGGRGLARLYMPAHRAWYRRKSA